MASNYPSVAPFTYVLIPCDETKDVVEIRFTGNSEEGLRETLTRHFRQLLLSEDQRTDMARHLLAKSTESAKRNAVHRDGEDVTEPVMDKAQQESLIDQYLEQTSFEIVPITMPMRDNQFIGTSLYIDDSGAFKDLSLNSRASKVAQRDIRGDAFLLSNHDDPALDEWGRIDCPITRYHDLFTNPPKTSYDPSNRAQMAQAAMLREAETKVISRDDVLNAEQAKRDGNTYFAAGDMQAAVQAYALAIELTEGRRDLLENEAEVTALRLSALHNSSLCLHRLNRFNEATTAARTAIQLDSSNMKGYYRLAQALIGTKDYEAAKTAVDAYQSHGGAEQDATAMRSAIAAGSKAAKSEERKKFAKMFA